MEKLASETSSVDSEGSEILENDHKTILSNVSGFVKPKQLVAIMGSSGSGKTTFLNFLAQRMYESQGSKISGEVRCNNKVVDHHTFGKFAAFVQQDDVLLGLMTPKESLSFACRLRTNLNETQIVERVKLIIERMSLKKCENTLIGGGMFKGISGGERKRVAIGYELITSPQLLLLDEPTSGLDSFTAYNVVSSLRRNANDGMTIMCTIHSPSSKTFELFDILILMHEGRVVYQGPTKDLYNYLCSLGVKFERY